LVASVVAGRQIVWVTDVWAIWGFSSIVTMHRNAFAVKNVMQQQNGPFRRCRGDGSAQRGRSVIYDCLVILAVGFLVRRSDRTSMILKQCNPWPHVANRHMSISQLLSSCYNIFTVLNSGLLFYTKRVSTTPTSPSQPPPPSPTH